MRNILLVVCSTCSLLTGCSEARDLQGELQRSVFGFTLNWGEVCKGIVKDGEIFATENFVPQRSDLDMKAAVRYATVKTKRICAIECFKQIRGDKNKASDMFEASCSAIEQKLNIECTCSKAWFSAACRENAQTNVGGVVVLNKGSGRTALYMPPDKGSTVYGIVLANVENVIGDKNDYSEIRYYAYNNHMENEALKEAYAYYPSQDRSFIMSKAREKYIRGCFDCSFKRLQQQINLENDKRKLAIEPKKTETQESVKSRNSQRDCETKGSASIESVKKKFLFSELENSNSLIKQ